MNSRCTVLKALFLCVNNKLLFLIKYLLCVVRQGKQILIIVAQNTTTLIASIRPRGRHDSILKFINNHHDNSKLSL